MDKILLDQVKEKAEKRGYLFMYCMGFYSLQIPLINQTGYRLVCFDTLGDINSYLDNEKED